jgi:beta-ribofuranosylaminobenzene 5'-phosphate synthase
MPDWVKVRANARLHLGFFDLDGGLGRRFGSLGLAIAGPVTSLSLMRADAFACAGLEPQRVSVHLATLCKHLGLAGAYKVTVHEAVPAHAGFGSGTQLALAVATALRLLEGIEVDAAVDAILLQRGARSGAGAALFRAGGLIVDGGQRETRSTARDDGENPAACHKGVPPILARFDFPEDWRIVLVMDPDVQGVHGVAEREAFARLPQFSPARSADICRSVLMQALPAVVERDLPAFGAAIAHIQRSLGDYFAPAQGGSRYASARVGEIMLRLEDAGAYGIGQSSWGPTGFAFAPSPAEAETLVAGVAAPAKASGLTLRICKAANQGAITQTSADNDQPGGTQCPSAFSIC